MKKNHYMLFSVLLGLFYGIGGIFFQNQVYAASNKTTHVRLSIYNSYSGHISFSPNPNITNIGGTLRTSDTSLSVIVSATTGSSFTIAGDIVTPIVGNGIGSYQISESLVLSPNDGIKNIQTSFMKGTEPYTDNTSIIVDTTPPTQTNLLSPDNNNTITGDITLSRSESTDTGIGLSHYKVHLSVDPGFLSETVITSTDNTLQVTANSMPIGILYRYVESIDLLGNHSTSISKLFHHTTIILPNPNENNSNGIGGGVIQPIYNTGTTIENNTGDDNTTVSTGDGDNIITGSIHTGNSTPPLELTGGVHNVGGEDNTNTPTIEQKDSPIPNNSSSENLFQNSQQKPYYQEAVSKGSNICNFLSYNEMCTAITNSTIYTEIVSTTPQTKNIIDTLLVQYDNFIVTILGTTAIYSESKTINMCKVLPEDITIQPYYKQELSISPIVSSITDIFTNLSYIIKDIKYGLNLAFHIYKTL